MSRTRKPHVVLKTGAVSRPLVTPLAAGAHRADPDPDPATPLSPTRSPPPASVTPALAPEHARFLDLLAAELEAALRESSALPSHDRITARMTRVREGLMRIAASARPGGHA